MIEGQLIFDFYEDFKNQILKHEKMIEEERNPKNNGIEMDELDGSFFNKEKEY